MKKNQKTFILQSLKWLRRFSMTAVGTGFSGLLYQAQMVHMSHALVVHMVVLLFVGLVSWALLSALIYLVMGL